MRVVETARIFHLRRASNQQPLLQFSGGVSWIGHNFHTFIWQWSESKNTILYLLINDNSRSTFESDFKRNICHLISRRIVQRKYFWGESFSLSLGISRSHEAAAAAAHSGSLANKHTNRFSSSVTNAKPKNHCLSFDMIAEEHLRAQIASFSPLLSRPRPKFSVVTGRWWFKPRKKAQKLFEARSFSNSMEL